MALAPDSNLDIAFSRSVQSAFPPVLVKLLKALLEPSPSVADIAKYLRMDALLTAQVLHIVNSSAYGFGEKITDIQRAVINIGVNELFKLVISLSVQKKLTPTARRNQDLLFGDWRLTFWSALAAEAIAARICPKSRQEAYLASILKDLPLFLAYARDDAPPFLQQNRYATLPTEGQFAEEMVHWGQSHCEIARDIFLYWGFPDAMAEAAAVHHDYANIGAYSPLAQSIIYATRWSELLHSPKADMPALFLFEMNMALELGLSNNDMSEFRNGCAERFNRLLAQLEISQAKPAMRIHEQSLTQLQTLYFLALGMLGKPLPETPQSLAALLQRQLRLTWDLKDWDLSISIAGDNDKSLFRCRGDHGLIADISQRKAPSPKADWLHIPIACDKRDFGTLIVPPYQQRYGETNSLPIFMSMVAVRLEEQRQDMEKRQPPASFESLPFVVARLDKKGAITRASSAFLDVFRLDALPTGMSASELLLRHLDIDLPPLENTEDGSLRSGFFLSVPEGHFPGTPLYISHAAAPDNKEESCLFIGDVTRMNSHQALAMAHQGLLSAFFETLNEQICLLDEEGRIVWADEASRELLGRNIFSLSRPEGSSTLGKQGSGNSWTKSFLTRLTNSTKVQTMLSLSGTLVPCTLIFSPLEGKAARQYLLVLHLSSPQTASERQEPQNGVQTAKTKDALTDLYGYSQFHMLLKYTAEQGRKQNCDTGIIFCDIEGLHKFNALHGCQKGDVMLRRVAGCLAENCRPGQDHACRYGSDKFAVVVHKASREMLDRLAADILQQVNDRCGSAIALNIGLGLIPPGDAPKTRLDAARKASEMASSEAGRILWAD